MAELVVRHPFMARRFLVILKSVVRVTVILLLFFCLSRLKWFIYCLTILMSGRWKLLMQAYLTEVVGSLIPAGVAQVNPAAQVIDQRLLELERRPDVTMTLSSSSMPKG